MKERDPGVVSIEVARNMPPKMKRTFKAAEDALKSFGLPFNGQVNFVPSDALVEADKRNDIRHSGFARLCVNHGLSPFAIIGYEEGGAFTPDGKTYFFSTEQYAYPFLEDINGDRDLESLGAVGIFLSLSYMHISESAKEIPLSSDRKIVNYFLDDYFDKIEDAAFGNPGLREALNLNRQIRAEIAREEGFEIKGKGAQVLIKKGEEAFIYQNMPENRMIQNFLVNQAEREFVKRMKKENPWFIAPDDLPNNVRGIRETMPAPSLDEIRMHHPGISIQQLKQDFLESRFAQMAFEKEVKRRESEIHERNLLRDAKGLVQAVLFDVQNEKARESKSRV